MLRCVIFIGDPEHAGEGGGERLVSFSLYQGGGSERSGKTSWTGDEECSLDGVQGGLSVCGNGRGM